MAVWNKRLNLLSAHVRLSEKVQKDANDYLDSYISAVSHEQDSHTSRIEFLEKWCADLTKERNELAETVAQLGDALHETLHLVNEGFALILKRLDTLEDKEVKVSVDTQPTMWPDDMGLVFKDFITAEPDPATTTALPEVVPFHVDTLWPGDRVQVKLRDDADPNIYNRAKEKGFVATLKRMGTCTNGWRSDIGYLYPDEIIGIEPFDITKLKPGDKVKVRLKYDVSGSHLPTWIKETGGIGVFSEYNDSSFVYPFRVDIGAHKGCGFCADEIVGRAD